MTHSDGTTTPRTPGARLRALLATGELIVAPGVFDGISAHLVRRTGFKAAYLTGPAPPPPGSGCRTSAWSPGRRWPSGPA